ncbi:methyl-accepting chemotaxis protein [Klebsiella sp. BIGb0407]|uniref:methyl-accepting chemotaxis protein n=1 Tax=Klebsiella sp. BIGb0407 TaxID=2940603 RepID=UPI002168F416|nr:methyl-accepting chemotaxis protein [Klebsiella sp. BIGb0407]MCS3434362.1 methyl-accepting chemotaxis protein [Klebsiella sp. BIGb0407]
MNKLKSMRLSTMLAAGFAVVIAIGFIVALFARMQLTTVANNMDYAVNTRLVNLQLIIKIKDNITDNAQDIRDLALYTTQPHSDDEYRTYIKEKNLILEQRIIDNNALLQQLDKALKLKLSREFMDRLNEVRPPYSESVRKAMKASTTGDYYETRRIVADEVIGPQQQVLDALTTMSNSHAGITVDLSRHYISDTEKAGNLLLLMTIISALIGLLIAWSIGRAVKKQLGGEPVYAVQVAKQVAEGDLEKVVTLQKGDNSSLLATMDGMRERLQQMVRQVRDSSDSISIGSREIAAGSADLSQRTEEQAASLQETAASMEQMSQTIRQNTDTVRSANRLAQATSEKATQSGKAVHELVLTMQDINSSSQKIGDIISVIDGIAFQTNILALNAAVESARAGEAGRGFAVVAGEVRSLAQRSASAANEIKGLIGESLRTVSQGSEKVSSVGETINDLVEQAHKVSSLISEIGVTTEEQGQGISQINDAIVQLDAVTQQNAALVEESASAAESLSDQAAKLVSLMSVFRIGLSHTTASVTPPQTRKFVIASKKESVKTDAGDWESF